MVVMGKNRERDLTYNQNSQCIIIVLLFSQDGNNKVHTCMAKELPQRIEFKFPNGFLDILVCFERIRKIA
jgi:hypothetical protein